MSANNTYTQLYIHCVFAVKYRAALIHRPWEEELRKYITGIIQQKQHKMISINNVADHLHLLVGLHPAQSISGMMQQVKGESAEWINQNKHTGSRFQWQEGFGAFSYSRSQVSVVCRYIENQKEHHKKETFLDEYRKMLRDFEVAFDERYIFKAPE